MNCEPLIVKVRAEKSALPKRAAFAGDLTIAEGTTLACDALSAQAVNISGTLEGNVLATGPVRFSASARVRGDVQGPSVVIDDGARFTGRLDCEFDLPPELGGSSSEARARASARR